MTENSVGDGWGRLEAVPTIMLKELNTFSDVLSSCVLKTTIRRHWFNSSSEKQDGRNTASLTYKDWERVCISVVAGMEPQAKVE
jgi:hypothetical protein